MKVTVGSGVEKALWSCAIPGFGQFLNQKYFKGIVLIIQEFLINVKANINTAIVLSFLGKTQEAVNIVNYQWLMFYPCVYIYSIWDAYRDGSNQKEKPLFFVPFAASAFAETIGVIYSKVFKIGGILLGPIFLPMVCIFIGFAIGLLIRGIILKTLLKDSL